MICDKWVHKRFSGISGKLTVSGVLHCKRCLEQVGLDQHALSKEVGMEPV